MTILIDYPAKPLPKDIEERFFRWCLENKMQIASDLESGMYHQRLGGLFRVFKGKTEDDNVCEYCAQGAILGSFGFKPTYEFDFDSETWIFALDDKEFAFVPTQSLPYHIIPPIDTHKTEAYARGGGQKVHLIAQSVSNELAFAALGKPNGSTFDTEAEAAAFRFVKRAVIEILSDTNFLPDHRILISKLNDKYLNFKQIANLIRRYW